MLKQAIIHLETPHFTNSFLPRSLQPLMLPGTANIIKREKLHVTLLASVTQGAAVLALILVLLPTHDKPSFGNGLAARMS